MTQVKNFKNARPSSVSNLGQDISGAARHRNDTFDNPEHERQARFKKESTARLKALKQTAMIDFKAALNESTESAQAFLKAYEFKKCVLSCDLFTYALSDDAIKNCDVSALKAVVLGETDKNKRETMRKAFNRLVRVQSKIRYIRPIELSKYFETKTKDSFKEFNGTKSLWSTESKSFDAVKLEALVKAVQFGNSVTDSERIYCSENLIKSLDILNQHFDFDFKTIGFSYGARGKAGSIAFYQDSLKVLQFNRHWDGALIHELGHAIDYSLGLVSSSLPYSIRSKYRAKLIENKVAKFDYYMGNKEIFARLFEQYCLVTIPELSTFALAIYDTRVMPELDGEAIEFMGKVLKPILKGV